VFNEARIKLAQIIFEGQRQRSADLDTQRENAEERIRTAGPGLELLRRASVAKLRAHMEGLYEHGSTADIFALCGAFDLKEQDPDESANSIQEQAILVESFLAFLGVSPDALIDAITSLAH
jgi:hypothetical protein